MSKKNSTRKSLGLPFEYKKLPEFFDALCVNDNTEHKNGIIENILRKNTIKTVLDLTCGTGSQVFFLTKHGYKVVGADFSPALLDQARKRAALEKVNITFIDGDMRTLKVGHFNAVITIFNAVGHLTKLGFEKAIKNIHKNLDPGGIYIFDILNLEAMTEKAVSNLSYHVHKKINNTQIHTVQCLTLDKGNGILTAYDTVIIQKNATAPKRFHSKFSLQIYTPNELKEMLIRNGFEIIDQRNVDSETFLPGKITAILTTAKKI